MLPGDCAVRNVLKDISVERASGFDHFTLTIACPKHLPNNDRVRDGQITFEMKSSNTVREFMDLIKLATGVPVLQQRLTFAGKIMQVPAPTSLAPLLNYEPAFIRCGYKGSLAVVATPESMPNMICRLKIQVGASSMDAWTASAAKMRLSLLHDAVDQILLAQGHHKRGHVQRARRHYLKGRAILDGVHDWNGDMRDEAMRLTELSSEALRQISSEAPLACVGNRSWATSVVSACMRTW